jgi:hypothetical protein
MKQDCLQGQHRSQVGCLIELPAPQASNPSSSGLR